MASEPRTLHPVTFFERDRNPSHIKDFRALPEPAVTFQKEAQPTTTFQQNEEEWPIAHSDEAPPGEVIDDDDPVAIVPLGAPDPEFITSGPAPD